MRGEETSDGRAAAAASSSGAASGADLGDGTGPLPHGRANGSVTNSVAMTDEQQDLREVALKILKVILKIN